MQCAFENVKGYKTYENAKKRGEWLEEKITSATGVEFSWVVIALPNGRFTPMAIHNNELQPAWVVHEANCCIA